MHRPTSARVSLATLPAVIAKHNEPRMNLEIKKKILYINNIHPRECLIILFGIAAVWPQLALGGHGCCSGDFFLH